MNLPTINAARSWDEAWIHVPMMMIKPPMNIPIRRPSGGKFISELLGMIRLLLLTSEVTGWSCSKGAYKIANCVDGIYNSS
jgi:hypothetical protein